MYYGTINLPTSDPPLRSVIHCPEIQNCSELLVVNLEKVRSLRKSSPYTYYNQHITI